MIWTDMEKTVKVDFKIFNPGVPTANGRLYDEEMFSKAVKEYMESNKDKLIYFDDNDCGCLNHKLEDVCGKIEHVNRNEDNSFTAEAIVIPATLAGKMVCDILNDEKIDSSRMCITPDGFYDPENDTLKIMTYSVSFEPKVKEK